MSQTLSRRCTIEWCDGYDLADPSWRTHHSKVRHIVNPFHGGQFVDVSIAQYGNDGPQVAITHAGPDETVVSHIPSNAARALAMALISIGHGGQLAEALATAADRIEATL